MTWSDKHIKWLDDTGANGVTLCGKVVPIYRFNYVESDDKVMSAWAYHFRNHYCEDSTIDSLRAGYKISRKDYLLDKKFPAKKPADKSEKTGPATRSGDFAEILVADYISVKLKYWVPRVRYEFKVNRNTSEHGADVMGMKFNQNKSSPKDELLVFEVKATLSGSKKVNRLQDAINHSDKDRLRVGESLNAVRQRLQLKNRHVEADYILRFQSPKDDPYVMKYGAAAVITDSAFDSELIAACDTKLHKNRHKLQLCVINGADMMKLVHNLYERAADEA
ncbi:DUF1837 domain-containing protein [Rugamonas sp. FT82W]|uniref:DUF1837 domain-containing protein n=2 Tax=Duganella vulcania TaxID=2692166 RepID=A0A845G841_9BURK|nr:DUF1837 domain-containing protein [Duganella vulcania]